jgi:hypothetical protein
MSNILYLIPGGCDISEKRKSITFDSNQCSSSMSPCTTHLHSSTSSYRIDEIEKELLEIIDEHALRTKCNYTISNDNLDQLQENCPPDLNQLIEILVFSPEIQQEGFAGSPSASEEVRLVDWGDVFVKIGEEYPFLFTVYTGSYVRNQFIHHGEKITPSSRDIVLKRKHLQREDIIRAVIKWANLYCPALMGKPISLESDSILQTLVCDPFVEIQCPDSVL